MASVESIILKYRNLPIGLVKLLRMTSEYYSKIQDDPNVIVDITIVHGESGSTSGSDGEYTVTIPTFTGQGKIPMSDLSGDGTGGISNTFMRYDEDAALVHELGHVILGLAGVLSSGSGSELNIAILNSLAGQVSNITELQAILVDNNSRASSINYLKERLDELNLYGIDALTTEEYILRKATIERSIETFTSSTGWSKSNRVEVANSSRASFENAFNLDRNYVSLSGISSSDNLYRTGYVTHNAIDVFDKQWKTYNSGVVTHNNAPLGNLWELIDNKKSATLLGNQFNNESLITGDGDDYI